MSAEYVIATEHIRAVVNGRVIVRRRGARIRLELAEAMGIVAPPPRPKAPAGSRPPGTKRPAAKRKRSSRA